MSDAIGTLLVLGLFLMVGIGAVSLVEPEYSYPEEHFSAQEICIKNDGVEKMEYDRYSIDVRCVDGAEFIIGRVER